MRCTRTMRWARMSGWASPARRAPAVLLLLTADGIAALAAMALEAQLVKGPCGACARVTDMHCLLRSYVKHMEAGGVTNAFISCKRALGQYVPKRSACCTCCAGAL